MLCYVSIAEMNNVAWYFIDDVTRLYFKFTSHNSPILCDIIVNMENTSGQSASLMILAMTVERFYATYFPFKYRNVTAKSLTGVAIVCVMFGFISSCLVTMTYGNEKGECFQPRSGYSQFIILLVIAQSALLFLIIPSILVAVFNALIVSKIKSRKFKQKYVFCLQLNKYLMNKSQAFALGVRSVFV